MVCIMTAASRDAEAGSAIGFRDTTPSQPSAASALMELVGKFAVVVALEPIIVAEARANLLDSVAHRLLKFCRRKVDGCYSAACISSVSSMKPPACRRHIAA